VYINNLTEKRAAGLSKALESYPAYVGYVDCTCTSKMKDWLSTTLTCVVRGASQN